MADRCRVQVRTCRTPGSVAGASVTIPEGVRTFHPFTFSGCTSLTSITIPDGISFIF
jgi:hypothetical protein